MITVLAEVITNIADDMLKNSFYYYTMLKIRNGKVIVVFCITGLSRNQIYYKQLAKLIFLYAKKTPN